MHVVIICQAIYQYIKHVQEKMRSVPVKQEKSLHRSSLKYAKVFDKKRKNTCQQPMAYYFQCIKRLYIFFNFRYPPYRLAVAVHSKRHFRHNRWTCHNVNLRPSTELLQELILIVKYVFSDDRHKRKYKAPSHISYFDKKPA